jgi:hypothetical protein
VIAVTQLDPVESFFLQPIKVVRKLAVRVLCDEVEMKMLIDVAKKRERGGENKNAQSSRQAQEPNQDAFVPTYDLSLTHLAI